ncbi:MAG TPA: hypothetical protein VFT91_02020 [Dehalococcoidia bacterium]|nr:hypothetical protein [Dehalococcoidia bacterium]
MVWVIAIPLALMFALCSFMMLSMVLRGWLGRGRQAGHGMMMCMSHDGHEAGAPDKGLLEELKAERDRLDALIARAGGEPAQEAGKAPQRSPGSCC